jgi:hypothetical protein
VEDIDKPQVTSRRLSPFWLSLGVITALLLLWQITVLLNNPGVVPLEDFIAFWTAGHLLIQGDNPYDWDQIQDVQWRIADDLSSQRLPFPIIMWNPPWALTLIVPFSLLDVGISRLLWLLVSIAIAVGCCDWLWQLYGGPVRWRWICWALALGFVPTLFLLEIGQITAFVLLGIVGFLYCEKMGRLGLAGACLAVVAIKPHLVHLFGLAVLLWSLYGRHWSIFVGFSLTLLGLLALPLIRDPFIMQHYLSAVNQYGPQAGPGWHTGSIAASLRYSIVGRLTGQDFFWVQLIPTIIGSLWLVPYWYWRRHQWEWKNQVPLLLLVSFTTAWYGAANYDAPLLLLPVIQAAVWLSVATWDWMSWLIVMGYLLVNLGLGWFRLTSWYPEYPAIWSIIGPFLLIAYLCLRSRSASAPATMDAWRNAT